ncbi:SDR family oxidoreductase [Sporosarcina sp. ACRSL]|uniref:SDR family oxidoreductase n=1 Tax=Sporosarcina sp. ACRSL TaxID=2918215 RepID=UPI001EF422FA|nr:SDR family oxidoreductase [Sporosarcina sp. ACRSL]MCG7344769.1 SDR family oxidoreductase [Sporosarcina sp. ACRSL]
MTDYLNYKGKKCVVLGGSNGMGKATVDILVDLGAEVYVLDILPSDNERVTYIPVDCNDPDSIKTAFDQLVQFDCFFGFAGVSGVNQPTSLVLSINFLSYKYMLDELLYDKMNENGSIAIVTSNAGQYWEAHIDEFKYLTTASREDAFKFLEINDENLVDAGAYSLSKRVLNYYSFLSAGKYAEKHIRINTVCPGFTATRLRGEFSKYLNDDEEVIKSMGKGYITRDAQPEEIAKVCVFVNSDMATFVNAEEVMVDGGTRASFLLKQKGFDFDPNNAPLYSKPVEIPENTIK